MIASPTQHLISDSETRRDLLEQEFRALGALQVYSEVEDFVQTAQRRPPEGLVLEAMVDRREAMAMYRALADVGFDAEVGQTVFDGDELLGIQMVRPSSILTGDLSAAGEALKHRLHQPKDMRIDGASLHRIRFRASMMTKREADVMRLVVQGYMNRETATKLGLSPKTVEVYRAHVMEKMQASSLAQLVRMAVLLEQSGSGYDVVTLSDQPKKLGTKSKRSKKSSTSKRSTARKKTAKSKKQSDSTDEPSMPPMSNSDRADS